MIRSRNRFLSLIVLLFFIAASFTLLLSHPAYADISNEEEIYATVRQTVQSLMDTEEEAVYGNEWFALELARDGQEFSPYYLKDLIDTIIENDGVLHTDSGNYTNYAKAVLVLTAFGIDSTNIAGYNLIEQISLLPRVQSQGVNGVIYALLALDSHQYDVQPPANFPLQITRDNYINAIISSQLEDGGWDYAGKQADPDMTAMAIQALAPYYDSHANVKASVDKALQTVSALQKPDGGFQSTASKTSESSESTSMVILALTALGIDPSTDDRFIKNGLSPIDNLCSFAVDGGFKHTANGRYNAMATEQGYRALVAYHRFLDGKTSFYDMTDTGDLQVIESALTEKILVTDITDAAEIEDIISQISNSPAFVSINGKVEYLFDIQYVLSDDANTVVFPLSESDEAQTITVMIPEESLSELGDSVLIIGIHNGEVFSIKPDSVDRVTGEVVFKASVFSTYSVVSGTAVEEPSSDDENKAVEPAKTGDDTDFTFWILLMAVSVLGIIITKRIHKQTK